SAGCQQQPTESGATPAAPTATPAATPTAESRPFPRRPEEIRFITVATDAPNRPFEDINEFGEIVGFDADVMADLAAEVGFQYEFVVTGFEGILNTVVNREFDVVMAALLIPGQPEPGLVYTEPYLEVGQVLVVRANERTLNSYHDWRPGVIIGAQANSSGEVAAGQVAGVAENDLRVYESTPKALQALIDGEVQGVIIDSDDAGHFTSTYPQQLKVSGGSGREAWITYKAYGIAVHAENTVLLQVLNQAISQARADGTLDRLTHAWLISQERIAAGESLIGTPPNELVIGTTGQLNELEPAAEPNATSWEVKINTMSGLLMLGADNDLVPTLAAALPTVSESKLEYTFNLRPGLAFPDGSELTAEDVKWSIGRSARLGSWLVNSYLKNSDDDGFADEDAVQVLDPLTIKIVLQEPVAHFPAIVATPPYFIINQACYDAGYDPTSTCGGLGPYNIVEWEPGVQIRLKANPQWPGDAPAFENVQLRFYDDPARMRRSLENSALDLAWTRLNLNDLLELRAAAGFRFWQGPAAFKSYLVFEQSQSPWNDRRVREAAAMAVDREALAQTVFNDTRLPLYSPLPDEVVGHAAVEPHRDLERARLLLNEAGYSNSRPLAITLWYLNDGRYTPLEEQYAQALKAQLEETGIFQVTLQGAAWEEFRPQSSTCNYPAFLLGWPPSGSPPRFAAAMDWLDYFVTDTGQVCSNYQSEAMTTLLQAAKELDPLDTAAQIELYRQIQNLWAREFPTLDLTQAPQLAISLDNVRNVDVAIDTMGLLHYSLLSKGGG
ncbi:MAG: ABC transporter substrate-binding protein, partial [Chloroflexota bacterium]